MDESEETHPFKCNFCTSKFSLMHEAQYHFVNFHQKKLEQTNIIEKRSSFEKKGLVVKQEPKPQQKEVDDDEIQEIELSGSYFVLLSSNIPKFQYVHYIWIVNDVQGTDSLDKSPRGLLTRV